MQDSKKIHYQNDTFYSVWKEMPNIEDFPPMEWNVSQDAEPANSAIGKDIETNSVNPCYSHFKNGELESWTRRHLNPKI